MKKKPGVFTGKRDAKEGNIAGEKDFVHLVIALSGYQYRASGVGGTLFQSELDNASQIRDGYRSKPPRDVYE